MKIIKYGKKPEEVEYVKNVQIVERYLCIKKMKVLMS